jgi:hypothetical protein
MFTIDSPNTIIIGFIGIIVLIIIIIGVIIAAALRRPRPAQAAKPANNKAATPAHPRLQEILRLARDPDTGRVVTEFQNRIIRDPRTLSKGERDYLVRLAKDWYSWLDIAEPRSAAKVDPSPAITVSSTSPASPDVPAEPAAVTAETISAEPVAADTVQANVPLSPVTRDNPAAAELLTSPIPRSIVQQVDDIVQEKLAAHPGPIPTIKLAEDPYEGVIVWVNQTKYIGIESVTDPDVRAIIRSAAVEWEHRTGK